MNGFQVALLSLAVVSAPELSARSVIAVLPGGRAEDTLVAAETWLASEGKRIVPLARCAMTDGSGIHGYVPQVGCVYDAVWLRDFYYVLEAGLIPTNDAVDCAHLFVRSVSADGYGVDCVRYDGTPVYKPGYGSMGENPVADGSPFTVGVAYEAWKQGRDGSFVSKSILDSLVKALQALPRKPDDRDGLVWIDPDREWDRCPYGFTDTVRKQGYCFFESLLEIQAQRQLAEMLEAAGRSAEAQTSRQRAESLGTLVNSTFWDESVGLYRAATVCCREHDVWGSAFAVWLGVAGDARADRVSAYFRDHYDEVIQNGQVRHLPGGTYWERSVSQNRYQNGGFWGTPSGWVAFALERTSSDLVDRLYCDLVAYYRTHGACEWFYGDTVAIPEGYLASVAQPLLAVRRIRSARTLQKTQTP